MCVEIEEIRNGSDYYALLIPSVDGELFHVIVYEEGTNATVEFVGSFYDTTAQWAAELALETL